MTAQSSLTSENCAVTLDTKIINPLIPIYTWSEADVKTLNNVSPKALNAWLCVFEKDHQRLAKTHVGKSLFS